MLNFQLFQAIAQKTIEGLRSTHCNMLGHWVTETPNSMEDPQQHHMLITWNWRGHDSLCLPQVLRSRCCSSCYKKAYQLVHVIIIFSFKARRANEAKMANSSSMAEKSYHVRSDSLPSTSHPITLKIEEVNKLKTWVSVLSLSTSTLRIEMIRNGLNGLKDLYYCVRGFSSITSDPTSHHPPSK